MRESYRDKQSRRARINREKEKKNYKNDNKKKNNYQKSYNYKDYKDDKNDKNIIKDKEYEDIVVGRNAVLELLKSDKDINKIFIENGEKHGSINEIIARSKEKKIVLIEVPKSKIDFMAENNQGVVAIVPPFNYCDVYDILDFAKLKKEKPFILILDGIEDVHNLGAIIRTAETAGVHGIIIPKRRNASVNSIVSKVSAGATSYMKIARVNNINETIKYLKKEGVWIIGTDGESKIEYYNQDMKDAIAIVIGNEGNGISNLVKKNVDVLIKIPMLGKITSLNASVSCGIILYETVKQRRINRNVIIFKHF